ncbi:hypothetical protein PoB_004478300 [Plakobranchus ocellatus]|uniref:Uncharacterized protein n=1 Tax=Plakobranchus ocellatus TaxID=259542 RepID=A0AAV4BF95_9GAST|nr:hypothetical protein PoB_004478300 [Plakobranchus ocellatus]
MGFHRPLSSPLLQRDNLQDRQRFQNQAYHRPYHLDLSSKSVRPDADIDDHGLPPSTVHCRRPCYRGIISKTVRGFIYLW